MSGKKLSTGTLSLKFMQNAQRAKQLKEVELEKAPVEDDGQWEVAKEIRESWGPTESERITTESSSEAAPPVDNPDSSSPSSSSVRPAPQIDSGIGRSTTRPITKSTKVAKLAIFDNSEVGTDLRRPTNTNNDSVASSSFSFSHKASTIASPSSNVFLKPAGVDEPKASNASNGSAAVIVTKRERKTSATQADTDMGGDGPKRKKKKKSKIAAD
ncbi:hypothetical protein BT96DRAFT_971690 [Gymnopus androsaceus JB14]|uniref:Uncharacterized protein n=1 Tax=Gymnopus androsaceus JB14 TaxID=1447944 RepID=A0A6A4ICZ0_9AGAR|nr:hypothetical protein BT96DRAFT_971690 [Gymnopus androsaceus JB14]